MNLQVLFALIAIPCDPMGSSGDAYNCGFCDDIKSICKSNTSLDKMQTCANKICNEDVEHDHYRQWLKDLACDASKISYFAGSVGLVTMNTSVASSNSMRYQLQCLQEVCNSKTTRKAIKKTCLTT